MTRVAVGVATDLGRGGCGQIRSVNDREGQSEVLSNVRAGKIFLNNRQHLHTHTHTHTHTHNTIMYLTCTYICIAKTEEKDH